MIAVPFRGARGGIVLTHRDITQSKLMEKNLTQAERKYRTVVDYNYAWEYWVPDDHIKYISPSCERITGYAPNDFMENHELIQKIILPVKSKTNRRLTTGSAQLLIYNEPLLRSLCRNIIPQSITGDRSPLTYYCEESIFCLIYS